MSTEILIPTRKGFCKGECVITGESPVRTCPVCGLPIDRSIRRLIVNRGYFVNRAKRLMRDLMAGDTGARARFEAVWHNATPSLMRCQHVLAREHGFDSWSDMLRTVTA